ncbi:CCA tRNA nucleotidyltransferase [Lentisphaerota bacterium WC36G]|nr:CCA tRNA nucleotidyltransferase [Lentisphaerae bacterium WC36]
MYSDAIKIIKKLQQQNFKAYFVGGYVRNTILGKSVKDIDIATSATTDEIKKIFSHYHEIGASFGVINIVTDSGQCFEVATLREEDNYFDGRHPEKIIYTSEPLHDAKRRDFTVNAMFYDPVKDEYLDFFNGMKDLKAGILDSVGDPKKRFSEDALRILRAVRFAVEYDFSISNRVTLAIKESAKLLTKLSAERIREELTKMLLERNPERAFRLMQKYHILTEILPEVAVLEGVDQHPDFHPEGDVFEHTMLMLRHFTLANSNLAWAILLHDVGKKTKQSYSEDGRVRFYCHEVESGLIAKKVLKRLKFSKLDSKIIIKAVSDHMRYAHVDQMRKSKWRKIIDYEYFPLELELHRIDCISSNGLMGNYNLLLQRYRECDELDEVKIEPIVNGKDLIALGFKPGVIFKKILNDVNEQYLDGNITSKDEAIKFIKNNFISIN